MHAKHWAQTMAAELDYPIMLMDYGDRRYLLDGYHRLLKAETLEMSHLPAKFVPEEVLSTILIQNGFLGELNQLRPLTPNLIATARQVALDLQESLPEGTFPEWQ